MSAWTSTVTNAGAELLSRLVAGETLNITRAVSGSTSVPIVDIKTQTQIDDEAQTLIMQPEQTMEDGSVIIPVVLENTQLKSEYTLWQVGIFAQHPEKGEILFLIAQAENGEVIPTAEDSPGFSIEWRFYFKNSNNVTVNVAIDPAGLVSLEVLKQHTENKENPHGVTAEQVGALSCERNDKVKYFTSILEIVNSMMSGGSFVINNGNSISYGDDYPRSGVDFHFLVLLDETGRKRVIAISFGSNNFEVFTRRASNNAWSDTKWISLTDVFLPLTGGTLSANEFYTGGGTGRWWGGGYTASMQKWNKAGDSSNFRAIQLSDSDSVPDKSKAFIVVDRVNGDHKEYQIYGEHNYPITNNTTTKAVTASNNLVTANTLHYHTVDRIGRDNSVFSPNTNYTTYMARGIALVTSTPSSLNNGTVAFVYA